MLVRTLTCWAALIGAAAPATTSQATVPPDTATYVVRLANASPPRFLVRATWPTGGSRLEMDTTRPGDVPELLERGWPALVTSLRLVDATGGAVEATPDGDAGWRLRARHDGPITAEYEVDTRLLAQHGWPAPREATFVEEGFISIVGRSLFITTDAMRASSVRFEVPPGWRAHAPWAAVEGERDGVGFRVPTVERLRENMIVLGSARPTIVAAGGFRVTIAALGRWAALRPEVRKVVRSHVRHFVKMLDFRDREDYLAILLPALDQGAESYRQSLALTFHEEPTQANEPDWANRIGHELFHYWNGWRMQGADYAASQWFQEGFTEYAANVSTVAAGLMTPARFREKLAEHVSNYRHLTTPLEAPGTRKGPPLYSGGALVALSIDLTIREATHEERGLPDFLRVLARRFPDSTRPYTRDDLIGALEEVAPRDWAAFLDAHVRGTTPLPLPATFALAGLRLSEPADGSVSVVEDPAASDEAKARWRRIVRGR